MSIFRLCDHYDDDMSEYINSDLADDICFICFDGETLNKKKPIQLKSQPFYLKTCVCNGVVHNECLKIWVDLNKSCPICRKKSNINMTIVRHIPYGITVYMVAERMSRKLLRFLSLLLFLYAVLDMYILINYAKRNIYEDYQTPFLLQNTTSL